MTESDWRGCTDPQAMLDFLRDTGRASERKLRLFAIECCHRIGSLLRDERSWQAVEASERYADGLVSDENLQAVRELASQAVDANEPRVADEYARAAGAGASAGKYWFWAARAAAQLASAGTEDVLGAVAAAERAALEAASESPYPSTWAAGIGAAARADLLRDVFGDPHRPVAVDPSWRTPEVVALAEQLYRDRDFDRLPELAGALEAAGCYETSLLDHCRRKGPHALGCWAVDAVLGKDCSSDESGQSRGQGRESPAPVDDPPEPHRGDLLVFVGYGALAVSVLTPWIPLLGLVSLPLGAGVLWTGRRDLEEMRAGWKDQAGERPTARGLQLGRWAAGLTLLSWGLWGLMHLLGWLLNWP